MALLSEYREKLRARTKLVVILGAFFAVTLAYKIASIILRSRGVKLPWLLDLLG